MYLCGECKSTFEKGFTVEVLAEEPKRRKPAAVSPRQPAVPAAWTERADING